MDKKDIQKVIVKCAKEYRKNLEGNNILFVGGSSNDPLIFETSFRGRNFLHLIGVSRNVKNIYSSAHFYKKCLNGRLKLDDFELPENRFTEKKLAVLPQLMHIHKTAQTIGEYNKSGIHLYTEKLVGNFKGCLGFVKEENRYYVPNTALNLNVREIIDKPYRISAILKKPISQENYTELCYAAKGVDLSKIVLPDELSAKISIPEFFEKKNIVDINKQSLLGNRIENMTHAQQDRQSSDQIQHTAFLTQDTTTYIPSAEKSHEQEKLVSDVMVKAKVLSEDTTNKRYIYSKKQMENDARLLKINNNSSHINENILGSENKTKLVITKNGMKEQYQSQKDTVDIAKQNERTRTEKAHQAPENSTLPKLSGGGGTDCL